MFLTTTSTPTLRWWRLSYSFGCVINICHVCWANIYKVMFLYRKITSFAFSYIIPLSVVPWRRTSAGEIAGKHLRLGQHESIHMYFTYCDGMGDCFESVTQTQHYLCSSNMQINWKRFSITHHLPIGWK